MNSIGVDRATQERIDGVSNRIAASQVPTWKRVLDCTLILIALPFWLPLGILIAAWVKLVSPGPALFRQERIGHMGARFRCLKFRTMKVNADTTVHREHLNHLMTSNRPMKKLDSTGDSRLIPGGLWLRSLGIDELPQIINVLRGDMSLVGPRPSTAYEYELFQPRHRRRCETLPGLTGLWQVNGKNRTTFEKMMELDVTYCETKSLFLDLKILISTPFAILRQVWDVRASRKAASQISSENTGLITRLNHGGVQRAPVLAETGHEIARGAVLTSAHRTSLRAAPGTTDI
jgi:lipopolysaccharide/colanic/teichoic acid biosynthesis glycosyltransferase